MQITPINNNQTNFRGDMLLRGVRKITPRGKSYEECVSVAVEHIESISSIAPKEYNPALNPETMDKLTKEDGKFKTLIKMISGDQYEVPYQFVDVLGAKKYLFSTNTIISPEGMGKEFKKPNLLC